MILDFQFDIYHGQLKILESCINVGKSAVCLSAGENALETFYLEKFCSLYYKTIYCI